MRVPRAREHAMRVPRAREHAMRTSREWLGVLVDRLDMLGDRLLQLDGRAVNPALDLLLRQIGEESLHPVEP